MTAKGSLSTITVSFLAGVILLTGCNQAERQMGTSKEGQQTRTAAVRGTDDMSQMSMPDQLKQCQGMMQQHLGNADTQYDQRFIDMMIPHHQGAVEMAQDAQQKAQHPEIKQLANKIINNQQKEIKQLQAWRKQWYGSQQAATNP